MDEMVACPDCGTPNRADADLCVQCWRGMDENLAAKIPVAAFAGGVAAPAPLAPPPPPRRFVRAPVREAPGPVREATPGPVPYFAPTGTPPVSPNGTITAEPIPAPKKRYSWKWYHLALIGQAAWGIPFFAQEWLIGDRTGRSLVDAALAVQVGAYLIAAVALACLVHLVQPGEWSSVGLQRSERTPLDLVTGGLLGLVLIGSFLGGYYLLNGHFGSDMLVRVLLGGTTGPGAILGAFVLVVGAPFIEEAYFRGMLYERFARRSVMAAIVGTSVLFVLFHGVGLWDPPRLLLGFALGISRRTRSLWFTIGAHAAWNGAIVVIALMMMSGPAHGFTSADGSFSLTHPAKWERMEEVETAIPGGRGRVELVLSTPSGSFLGVFSGELPPGVLNRANLQEAMHVAQSSMPLPPNSSMMPAKPSDLVMRGLVPAYEAKFEASDPAAGRFEGRIVLAAPEAAERSNVVVITMACSIDECPAANAELDAMLESMRFEV